MAIIVNTCDLLDCEYLIYTKLIVRACDCVIVHAVVTRLWYTLMIIIKQYPCMGECVPTPEEAGHGYITTQ